MGSGSSKGAARPAPSSLSVENELGLPPVEKKVPVSGRRGAPSVQTKTPKLPEARKSSLQNQHVQGQALTPAYLEKEHASLNIHAAKGVRKVPGPRKRRPLSDVGVVRGKIAKEGIAAAKIAKCAQSPDGIRGSMKYLKEGGSDAGRVPHPTVALRPDDKGNVARLKKMQAARLFTRAAPQSQDSHFPKTPSIPVIGPPLGPPLQKSGPIITHADPQWWDTTDETDEDPKTTTLFDEEAEIELQEHLLRILFPNLFFGENASSSSRKHLYRRFCFTGSNWTLGLLENYAAMRGTTMFWSIWDHEATGNISDALMRALDEKKTLDDKLRKHGLEENIFLSSFDDAKLKATRNATTMYRGAGYSPDGKRTVQSKGNLYADLQKELAGMQVGDVIWRTHGWATDTTGHCVVHLYEKTGPHSMSIIVANSGDGIGYHPLVATNSPGFIGNCPTFKRTTGVRVDHIDMNSPTFKDLGNWHMIERCKSFPHRLHGAQSYEIGIP